MTNSVTGRQARAHLLAFDPRRISLVVGGMLIGLAAFMLPPMATDFAAGSDGWRIFAISALITGFFGTMLVLISRWGETAPISRREGFLLTAASWLAMSVFAAIPFLFLESGMSFGDALFETVSGLTTTGSTVMTGLDTLPPGMLLWRSITQWIGGIGIIVMAIIMLPFLRVGGMQLFQTESSDRSDKIVPRAGQLVRYIALVYGGLTVICLVAYKIAGMSLFDAVNHAMTTIATGGFSTHDASFGFFPQPAVHWVAIVFMVLGSLPVVLFIRALRGGSWAFWRNVQVRGFLTIIAVFSIALGTWHAVTDKLSLGTSYDQVVFNVVSIISTTGYALGDYTAWGTPAIGAFFVLTFLGGCTGSTAGGIKVFRLQIMWLTARAYVGSLISPRRVSTTLYDGRLVEDDVPAAILAFVSVLFATLVVLTMALTAFGLDFVTSLTGAATALANVGPGLGPIIGPAGNFGSLPEGAKILLALAMLLGRLEYFTILVLLDPYFWRK